MAAYDEASTIEALEGAGYSAVLEASNIQGSPYRYLFVFFSPERYEGAYAIVSDRREIEDEDGWVVGGYVAGGSDPAGVLDYATLEEALNAVQRYAEELS